MNTQTSYSQGRHNRTMQPEQINQVIEAILDRKYSWACVLLLRFAGYNPIDYLPSRTYYRLLKENREISTQEG